MLSYSHYRIMIKHNLTSVWRRMSFSSMPEDELVWKHLSIFPERRHPTCCKQTTPSSPFWLKLLGKCRRTFTNCTSREQMQTASPSTAFSQQLLSGGVKHLPMAFQPRRGFVPVPILVSPKKVRSQTRSTHSESYLQGLPSTSYFAIKKSWVPGSYQ